MTLFFPEELNLICLYDPGNRAGTIYELRDMARYLMPDEKDLIQLTQGVITKLEDMTDEEYEAMTEDLIPETFPDFWDEDAAYSSSSALWLDEIDPDVDIE